MSDTHEDFGDLSDFHSNSDSKDVLLYLQEIRNEFNQRLTRIEDHISGNQYSRGQTSRIDDIENRLNRVEDRQLPDEQKDFVTKTYSSARSWKAIGGALFTLIMAIGGALTAAYYALKIIAPKFFS